MPKQEWDVVRMDIHYTTIDGELAVDSTTYNRSELEKELNRTIQNFHGDLFMGVKNVMNSGFRVGDEDAEDSAMLMFYPPSAVQRVDLVVVATRDTVHVPDLVIPPGVAKPSRITS